MSHFISPLVRFLLEGKDETDDDTTEPVDNKEDSDKKDPKADKDDVKADKADSKNTDHEAIAKEVEDNMDEFDDPKAHLDGEDTDKEDSDDESSDDDSKQDDKDSSDTDDDTKESKDKEEDPEKEKNKKLAIYLSLKELYLSFTDTISILDTMIGRLNISEVSSLYNINDKLKANAETLNGILNDVNTVNKSSKDLQKIYRIYLKDLKAASSMLKSIHRTLVHKKK